MVDPNIFVPGLKFRLLGMSTIKAKLASRLVGYRIKKYLVLEQPSHQGLPARMEEGTGWSVSFINEGDIISFNSTIIGSCRYPVPLIFLSYPESVDRTTLRQGKRFPVSIKAACTRVDGQPDLKVDPVPCLIRDISGGGCQVITATAFDPGDTLDITMELPDNRRLEGILAEVKSVRSLGGRYVLGLSFAVGLGLDGYKGLRSFTDSLMTTPIRI
ncbi:MAG: flagellar brake protein [Pseudomonadota bacterium]